MDLPAQDPMNQPPAAQTSPSADDQPQAISTSANLPVADASFSTVDPSDTPQMPAPLELKDLDDDSTRSGQAVNQPQLSDLKDLANEPDLEETTVPAPSLKDVDKLQNITNDINIPDSKPSEPVIPLSEPSVTAAPVSPIPSPQGQKQKGPSPINPEHFYSIGEAAQLLHVSIDTLRRWEQKGTIQASRTAGKLRRFKGQELLDYIAEEKNQDLLMPISDVAKKLNVSIQTLRRWDKSGRFRAERAADGARMYPKKMVQDIADHGVPQEPQEAERLPSNPPSHTTFTSPTPAFPKSEKEFHREEKHDSQPPHTDDRLVEKTEVLNTKALDVLQLQIGKHDVTKTAAAFDDSGTVVRPPVEDHAENSAGTATLPKGTNKVVIKTKAYRKDSLVFVTPTTATIEQLCVPIAIDHEGFAVVTAQIVPQDIKFNWAIISVVKG